MATAAPADGGGATQPAEGTPIDFVIGGGRIVAGTESGHGTLADALATQTAGFYIGQGWQASERTAPPLLYIPLFGLCSRAAPLATDTLPLSL